MSSCEDSTTTGSTSLLSTKGNSAGTSERQSRLVESVVLGIPIPPLFMATNTGAGTRNTWEVVDGLQRLLTLANFTGDSGLRTAAGLSNQALTLAGLEKLTKFQGATFSDLPRDIQDTLLDRPFKVIVLNDKSDLQVRYDLFERLNTGGISLTEQEIRECVYRGEFIDLLNELAESVHFKTVVKLPARSQRDGTPEEFVLRFFAFDEKYTTFDHSVKDFLGDFVEEAARTPNTNSRKSRFNTTFTFLASCFPDGLKSRKGQTPVNLFEGVAVGASQALQQDPNITPVANPGWLTDPTLRRFSTGATNSKSRVSGRIEFCRDKFLGR